MQPIRILIKKKLLLKNIKLVVHECSLQGHGNCRLEQSGRALTNIQFFILSSKHYKSTTSMTM